jgi:hypothetical protein
MCEKHMSVFMIKVLIELKFMKVLLYPSCTVVEHSTHDSKTKHSNPTAGIGREKMVKNVLKWTDTNYKNS